MQWFRGAGSGLAKLSPASSTNKRSSVYYYWRNLTLLKPRLQPRVLPVRQVPLVQKSTAHTCSAGETAATFPAIRSINKSQMLCTSRHPSRVLHILGARLSCIESAASVLGDKAAWLCNTASTEAGTSQLNILVFTPLGEDGHSCRNRGCSGSWGEDRLQR